VTLSRMVASARNVTIAEYLSVIPRPVVKAYGPSQPPPDLAEIIDAWPALPEPIRAGILAMIRTTFGKGNGR
jgi:hypothetical protein